MSLVRSGEHDPWRGTLRPRGRPRVQDCSETSTTTLGLVSVNRGERGFVSDRCPGVRGAWRALLIAGCRCRLLGSMALDPCIGLTVLAAAAVGHPAAGPHTLSGGTASVSSSGKSLSA